MLSKKGSHSFIFLLIGSMLFLSGMTIAGDTMTVQADILDTGLPGSNGSGTVSIQVPDFIDLGEVDENGDSDEPKIYVNNTGTVAITVTPTLIDYTDEIFTNLYFREFKTSQGQPVPQTIIGDWSFNISAPSSGQTYKSKYFYMQLDLSEADVDVASDLEGHQANVKFIATAQ